MNPIILMLKHIIEEENVGKKILYLAFLILLTLVLRIRRLRIGPFDFEFGKP